MAVIVNTRANQVQPEFRIVSPVFILPPGEKIKPIVAVFQEEKEEEIGGGGAQDDEVLIIPKPIEVKGENPIFKTIAPTECVRYTQGYHSGHRAVDIAPVKDCESRKIVAVLPGTVTYADYNGPYGFQVWIEHADDIVTTYAHLDPAQKHVEKGDIVTLGQEVGTMGLTGRTTGLHLHFEIIYQGRKLDPKSYIN